MNAAPALLAIPEYEYTVIYLRMQPTHAHHSPTQSSRRATHNTTTTHRLLCSFVCCHGVRSSSSSLPPLCWGRGKIFIFSKESPYINSRGGLPCLR